MRQIRFLVASTALVTLIGFSPAFAETLSEAVQTAISTHPKVGAVVSNKAATQQELEQAKSLFRPQVDVRGEAGIGWADSYSDAVDDGDGLSYGNASLSLRQMLFDGYEAKNEEERQRQRVLSSGSRVKETAELVALDATEAYLNVLRARQIIEQAEKNLAAHRGLLADIAKRERGGAGTRGDVQQARARVAQAEAALIQVEGDLRDAEARYNNFVGKFPVSLVRPVTPVEMMPAGLAEAVTQSIESNPTVAIRKADVSVAEAEKDKTKAAFYPRVDLEGNMSREANSDILRNRRDEATLSAVARWNLYKGGADTARELEFVQRQAEAEQQLADARRTAEEQMRRAWSAREAAQLRAEKYAQQVKANEQVLGAYKKQFDGGERTLLDVLDAQNELFVSNANMISSYYAALLGDYQVLAERGALLASLGVTLPADVK